MKTYHLIVVLLERYFDSRLGFSDLELERDFSKKLSNAKYRRELLLELESALVDPDVSWVEWFTGNHVEDDFENEADARAFAKELLYDPAFEAEIKESRG